MKAVVFERFGDPAEVLQLRDVPRPEPGRGQVRVRMTASPINPSDLLVVRGEYGRLPSLPATPGFEGAGIIDAAGPGLLKRLRRLVPGRRVAVPNGGGGNWQEYVVVPARQVIPVPADLPDDQAATFFVNPATALAMTQYVLRIPRGAWLVQTAAGSALGRMIIRLGRHAGFRTINVVRRRDLAEELLRAGADAAICTCDESIEERVQAITGGAGAPFALDAVAGTTGSAVARTLAHDGRMLVYGTLSAEPLTIHSRVLMEGNRRIEGFWLSKWVREQGALTMLGLFRRIADLMQKGILVSPISAHFPLEEIRSAVKQAELPGRPGKILLRMTDG